jgi:hypothetical protein
MTRHPLTTRHPRRNITRCACGRDAGRIGRPGEVVAAIICSDCRRRTREWCEAERAGQLRFPFVGGK